MTISNDNKNNPPNANSPVNLTENNRIATRYVREDISASVNIQNLFGLSKTIDVELLDITSKGVLVATKEKLGINKKITLILRFKAGKIFEVKAKVVRHTKTSKNEYGIQFDRYNNELGDYLLETQNKLVFK